MRVSAPFLSLHRAFSNLFAEYTNGMFQRTPSAALAICPKCECFFLFTLYAREVRSPVLLINAKQLQNYGSRSCSCRLGLFAYAFSDFFLRRSIGSHTLFRYLLTVFASHLPNFERSPRSDASHTHTLTRERVSRPVSHKKHGPIFVWQEISIWPSMRFILESVAGHFSFALPGIYKSPTTNIRRNVAVLMNLFDYPECSRLHRSHIHVRRLYEAFPHQFIRRSTERTTNGRS